MNANVGMLHPVVAPISSYAAGSAVTYGAGMVVEEARAATLTWNRSDGHFFGDDVELDTDNSITGYSIEFEPTGLSVNARVMMLGEVENDGELAITDESAPDVGFGYIRRMRTKNASGKTVEKFEAWWFWKLKFSLNSEETRTKEQSVEWRTPTVSGAGVGVQTESGGTLKFATHKEFDTMAEAIAYIEGKAHIASAA